MDFWHLLFTGDATLSPGFSQKIRLTIKTALVAGTGTDNPEAFNLNLILSSFFFQHSPEPIPICAYQTL